MKPEQQDSGWDKIVHEMLDKLNEINPDFKVLQIKQKFCELMVYLAYGESVTKEQQVQFQEVIQEASEKALCTCEECGQTFSPPVEIPCWGRVLCPEHRPDET